MPFWLRLLVAVAIGSVILWLGIGVLRSMGEPRRARKRDEAEEVGDLEVFFVCGECGTEFKVTRLGELAVPRHCGEEMHVVQRPATAGPVEWN